MNICETVPISLNNSLDFFLYLLKQSTYATHIDFRKSMLFFVKVKYVGIMWKSRDSWS